MLDLAITWLADVFQHGTHLAHGAASLSLPDSSGLLFREDDPTSPAPIIPDPGQSVAPPGEYAISRMLSWGLWIALGACVAGFLIIGARMGLRHQRGEGGGHAASLALCGFGCIVVVTARVIVEEIIGAGG
ncbi:hypothetical protein [Actinomadura algeriensis]|uniref:DUF4190 domain-containing protein n=1 Tax=Actinomadura algeriensis TaxID=1679523 RepID=A0ABR9JQL8_9ACTN|nr:hypothetical protein [Actinomadura algeriensis]MBE1532868.1 hypothetical protein [Actinomadura algeriensis]